MKALNFLEWYIKDMETGISHQSKVNTIANFYNQPFSVEMLVNPYEKVIGIKADSPQDGVAFFANTPAWQQAESKRLFKGWEKDTKDDYCYEFCKVFNMSSGFTLKCNSGDYFEFKTPNDFITLCNLAGIELQWNESNVKGIL